MSRPLPMEPVARESGVLENLLMYCLDEMGMRYKLNPRGRQPLRSFDRK